MAVELEARVVLGYVGEILCPGLTMRGDKRSYRRDVA